MLTLSLNIVNFNVNFMAASVQQSVLCAQLVGEAHRDYVYRQHRGVTDRWNTRTACSSLQKISAVNSSSNSSSCAQ